LNELEIIRKRGEINNEREISVLSEERRRTRRKRI